jgi:molecular chaperone GrpE
MDLRPDAVPAVPDSPEPPEGGPPPAAAPETEALLSAREEEIARLTDRLQRLQAEFENYKRRAAREKADFLKFANEGLLLSLLPVLDSLERAQASAPPDTPPAFADGVEMIIRLFRSALEKAGVAPLEASGKPFDPALHQAVAQVETADGEDNLVVDEIQRGYLLEGRVLRPAMVRVSRRVEADGTGEGQPS